MIEVKLHSELKSKNRSFEIDVDFSINEGDFVAIHGESGAGKTTILRMLAGLSLPKKGRITIQDVCWFDSSKNIRLTPQQRKTGMVFQDYALFPNMSVRQNLTYALQKGQSKSIIDDLIGIFELEDLQHEKTTFLSGGQKQRVALARALVQKPKLLLLDEPLSALDDKRRQKLQGYILEVHEKFELTTFIVSHDLSEIFRLATKVIQLKDGKIIKFGTPEDIFLDQDKKGTYHVVGTVITIEKESKKVFASVLSGHNLVKVNIDEMEMKEIQVGDQVMVVAKEFNPSIVKI